MPLQGLVQPAEIAALDTAAFRKLINRVLGVETSIHGVPLTDLDVTLRENDPDAGIDARIKWPDLAPADVLFGGENVLQYKTGKVTKKIVGEEFYKPEVQRYLRDGGHYHFLMSQDVTVARLNDLRTKLGDLCKTEGFDEAHCHVLAAGHISRWVCRHPAIIICPELGKGLPGFSTVEAWSHRPDLQNPWRPDDSHREAIERVGGIFRRGDVQDSVIRIEGPAGAGKTRLAQECIKAAKLEDRTIYVPNSDGPEARQLVTAVQADPQAHAIVVADECDRDCQNVLKSFADLAGGRLRLICVGPGDILFDTPANFENLLVVGPMEDANMREVLSAELGSVPPFVTEIAVRLSGGYPKLAFFVARAVIENSSISPDEMRKIRNVRDFLQRFLPSGTLNVLRALSLLQRLGWEAELRPEAEAVATYLGIPFTELQDAVKTLRDQGVVAAQGRYLYVTPELLAISAAADLWDARGAELIRIIENMPTLNSRRELLRRLAAMGRHPEVRKVVEMLLGENGLFQALGDLDDEFRSGAFRILTSAVPEAAVDVLERIIERAPRDQLLRFKVGRRNVIWAIESLLRWPEISLRAARSLRSLALAENEKIGNNATGIFKEYFQMYLSRSPINYAGRLKLVDELVDDGSESSRNLAVSALGAGLSSYETRNGGDIDELARRPYPPEWRPKTWGELRDARRAVLSRLEGIAGGADEAAKQARKVIIGSIFTQTREGMLDDTIKILQSIKPETDDERRQVFDVCARLDKESAERLSQAQKIQLKNIRAQVFGTDYFSRVKRWVGRRLFVDFNLNAADGLARADAITASLADEGLKTGISDEVLGWLASTEAENVWTFGLRLGELDAELRFFWRIVTCSSEDVNALFLAAYLMGQAKVEGSDRREQLIDQLSETHPMKAFTSTWRGEASHRGFERIVGLVKSGKIESEKTGFLMYGGWTKSLSANDVATLVEMMLSGERQRVLEPCMSMLHDALQREPKSIGILEPVMWEVLESTPAEAGVMVTWRWGQLARIVAARDPQKMIQIIIRDYSSRRFVPLSDERQQVLQTATEADPSRAWNAVADVIMSGGDTSSGLLTVLRKWYGELIPIEHLIAWAKANQPKGPRIVAHLIGSDLGNPSSRARALVLAFKGNVEVWNELYANMVTGFWQGPYSGKIARDLTIAKQWAEDPDPEFQAFAKDLIKELEHQLRQQKIREEEGEFFPR